jgi:AsmA family protein
MQANALVFGTEVTTLFGTGSIDLGQEKRDLTLRQKTKNTSPLALRSPIHIRGSFARPEVEVDMAQMTARARRDFTGRAQSRAGAAPFD